LTAAARCSGNTSNNQIQKHSQIKRCNQIKFTNQTLQSNQTHKSNAAINQIQKLQSNSNAAINQIQKLKSVTDQSNSETQIKLTNLQSIKFGKLKSD
jgi:hypothetical protein